MARSRNIKPGFFKNDLLAEINPLGRILFAGLWTIADREGRLEDRPKRIKAEILPYDDCDIIFLLDELEKKCFIRRYSVEKEEYIQITGFNKHQNPHNKEQPSVIPPPDDDETSTMQAPYKPGASMGQEQDKTGSCRADSLNLIPDSLKPIKNKAEIESFFIECWELYPNKKGKGKISDTVKEKRFNMGDEFKLCIKRYAKEVKSKEKEYVQHGSTFWNSGYLDYTDENYNGKVDVPQKTHKPFVPNFVQFDRDTGELL